MDWVTDGELLIENVRTTRFSANIAHATQKNTIRLDAKFGWLRKSAIKTAVRSLLDEIPAGEICTRVSNLRSTFRMDPKS